MTYKHLGVRIKGTSHDSLASLLARMSEIAPFRCVSTKKKTSVYGKYSKIYREPDIVVTKYHEDIYRVKLQNLGEDLSSKIISKCLERELQGIKINPED